MANPATDLDFKIGTTIGGEVTLASLGIVNPHPIWHQGVQTVKLGDNSGRLLGAQFVEWAWGFLSQASRDVLRASYCPGASALIVIVTPTTEKVAGVPNASARYQGQVWWPAPNTPEDPQAGRRVQFSLTIKQLIAV